jgi:hypothetical protein
MELSPSPERHLCCVVGETLEQAGYNTWGFMEPSNFIGEDCGGMNHNVELADILCDVEYPFVCEFET